MTFRTIGGILDFFVFLGPSPADVISQYTDIIGKPFLPTYWSLGFHLCRYGYTGTDEVKKVIARNRALGIPYVSCILLLLIDSDYNVSMLQMCSCDFQEVQWTDIDYMDAKLDWTYDPTHFSELPAVADDLHAHGQKYIMIIVSCLH